MPFSFCLSPPPIPSSHMLCSSCPVHLYKVQTFRFLPHELDTPVTFIPSDKVTVFLYKGVTSVVFWLEDASAGFLCFFTNFDAKCHIHYYVCV